MIKLQKYHTKLRESYEPVDFYVLSYNFKNLRIPSVSFSKFKGPMNIFKRIYKVDITLEDVEKEQIELRKDLVRINQEDAEDKSPK